jgi:prolipoprotein diacylglyceryltransferase
MRHLIWHVDPAIFVLGPIEIRWYGLFFALGFLLGFQIMAQFAGNSESSKIYPSSVCI